MYHMIWHICDPDFCFPCKVFGKLFECFEIKECCHVNFTCCNILCHFLNFLDSFRLHRSNRSHRFHKVQPIFICNIKNYIWHFVVKSNIKTQCSKFSSCLTKSFSVVSPTYRHSELGAKRGANSSIIAFCS